MLGGRDRRVSPHQGLELYKALKSRASPVRYNRAYRGFQSVTLRVIQTHTCDKSNRFIALPVVLFVPSRLLWFPEDGHSLSRVDTLADCFLNTVLWLQQHLQTHTHQKEFCC